MFEDLRQAEAGTTFEADVCIVGAGPAGISMALAFAGSRTKVLLLESGGMDWDADAQALYEGENVGLPYFDLTSARLRQFGGTSGHWDNWCGEFTGIDFRKRDWVPHSGWPIGTKDLAPYYEKARPLCGLGPARPKPAIWNAIGAEPLPVEGSRLAHRFWEFAGPVRFGEEYREPLGRAENVRVLLHSNVVRVQAAPDARSVTHLDISTLDGRASRVRAQSYVLACGGIENARLLLASDDVQAAGLGNGHDLVGRFFQEHPLDVLGTVATDDPHGLIERFGATWVGKHGFTAGLVLSDAEQERAGVLNCSVMMRYSARADAVKTIQRMVRQARSGQVPDGVAEGLWNVVQDMDMLAFNVYRRALLGRPLLPKPETLDRIAFVAHNEQAPNPDSRVTLTGERDALGMRRVALDWRLTEQDKRTSLRLAEAMGAEFARMGTGLFRIEGWLRDGTADWSSELGGGYHHMGTTRMAADPRQGVVDADCRVHGVENLYVAGSSVFATGGNINPTLTIVALALRLTDHLKQAWA